MKKIKVCSGVASMTVPLRIHTAKPKISTKHLTPHRNRGVPRANDPEPLQDKAPRGDPPTVEQRFCLTNVSCLLDARKNAEKQKYLHIYFFVCKGLSNGDVGVARATVFSSDTAGSWFQNQRFRSRKVVGAAVEGLVHS